MVSNKTGWFCADVGTIHVLIYIPFNAGEVVTYFKESEGVMKGHEFFGLIHWNIYINVLAKL